MRKIRELGSLPSDAFDKYQGLTLSQVGRVWKDVIKVYSLTSVVACGIHM